MGASPQAASQERLLHDYLAAWNARDADRIAAMFGPDGVYDDRGAGVVARGRDAIREHVAAVHRGFPDLEFELVRALHEEGVVAGEWRSRMTHAGEFEGLRASGRRVRSAGVDVATLAAGGRIAHLVSYYDGAAIMRELGLLPRRGSRAERTLLRLARLLPRR